MKTYNVLANMDFQIPFSVTRVAEWDSDNGEYTEDPYQSVRIVIPDEYATALELALDQDDNVINYDCPTDYDYNF